MIIRVYLSILFFIGAGLTAAQPVRNDSVSAAASKQDTVKHQMGSGIDTLVNYSAKDSIVYSLRTRYMNLYGKSEMQYQTLGLTAERTDVNWDDATLFAYGVRDTSLSDSVIGKPIMKESGDEYHGDEVTYNFHTRKGKITIGKTHMENGYYVGEEIKKVETNVLCVADGTYTTCDNKDPHFYFKSPKMKVFVRDKVVAEPVFFYLAGVPIFALPFGVFPAHAGRTSGIIMPAYGQDDRYGWYLSHFGYFWAASDYWDIGTMFDLFSRGRWQNRTNIRYALRYNFSGSLTTRFTSSPEGEPGDPNYNKVRDYYMNLTHNQQITPTSRLDVNFTFMSNSYFKNYSTDFSEILQQNVISNATYWKNWELSNRSLTISANRDQNLTTDETNEVLPSISFSQGTIFPFRKTVKTRGLSSNTFSEPSFIEMLGFSYNANFNNTRSKTIASVDSINTTGNYTTVKSFRHDNIQSLSQGLSFSISPKFGYFTVSPSLSLNDSRTWTQTETPGRDTNYLLISQSDRMKKTNGVLNTGVNTSTRFYGIFQPNIFGITAIRHTVTPTFGIFYNKQIYGDNMHKYSMTGQFNIGNNFEVKYQKSDSAKTEDKIQLLNISGGVSYNFAADSMNFSPVNINFRTDIGQYLGISGSASYNLYEFDPKANNGQGGRVNKLLLKDKGIFGDMTSFSLSLSTSFRGEKKQKPNQAGIPEKVLQEQSNAAGDISEMGQRKMYYSIYDREEADFSIPWNISINYNFSQSQPTPYSYSRSSTVNASLSFNLTEKWQMSTSGSYDFVNKQHFIPSVSVTRDLHCWQMSFSWFPMGTLEGYRFELKIKAPQLQDIKVTKQSNNRGSYNY